MNFAIEDKFSMLRPVQPTKENRGVTDRVFFNKHLYLIILIFTVTECAKRRYELDPYEPDAVPSSKRAPKLPTVVSLPVQPKGQTITSSLVLTPL